jgi:hypothetical protein
MEEALQLNLFSVPEAQQPLKKEVAKPKNLAIEKVIRPAPEGYWKDPKNQVMQFKDQD